MPITQLTSLLKSKLTEDGALGERHEIDSWGKGITCSLVDGEPVYHVDVQNYQDHETKSYSYSNAELLGHMYSKIETLTGD